MTETTEQKVAAAVLETPLTEIQIDGVTYKVEPPTTATLIMASGLISTLPDTPPVEDSLSMMQWVLQNAVECGPTLGRIAATLILGAKRIKEQPMIYLPQDIIAKKWSWRRLRKIEYIKAATTPTFERDWLADKLLQTFTATQLYGLILTILPEAGISDFFLLTTSLRTNNILRPTRGVETKTTASGHSS